MGTRHDLRGDHMPGRLPQIANTVSRGYFGDDMAAFLRQ